MNPGRGPKASVRLNNGPWVGITNQNVDVFDHEAEYGGLNGGYHTLRMTVPLSALGTPQAGANTLSFRFNGTDGHTSGFRVLALNFLRAGGSEILPENAFVEDDPTLWAPISTSPADLAAGEQLWRTAQLVERPGGPSIQASCSDCHAQDGRDLWYFAYSNESIVARSRFHGLSQAQAEKVASYIRSLQDSDPTYAYDPPGRPWNPPYQPGPGLDALPAHQWSAGAGLEGVLEKDEDTIPHMFPNGIFGQAAVDAVATDGVLNMREIPLSIQLPDWNDWLPEEHPVDIWGSTFTNDQSNQAYLTARNQLSGGVNPNTVDNIVERISDEMRRFWMQRGAQDPYRSQNNIPEVVRRHRSQFHWATVKTWEIMQDFELEGLAPQVYPEHGEARSWFGQARNLFELAPHLTTNKKEVAHPWQNNLVGKYFSTAWYHAQLIVNSGNVEEVHQIKPVDWNYTPAHILDLGRYGGPKQPVRYLLSLAKLYQMASHYEDTAMINAPFGVSWKQQHPWRFNPNYTDVSTGLDPGTMARLYEAMLGAYMDYIDTVPISAWPRRADSDGDGAYCDEDLDRLKPASWNGDANVGSGHCSRDWGNINILNSASAQAQGRYAELWYWMIPAYRGIGVQESTLNRLINWGEAMWPHGAWDDLRVETTSTPPVASNDAISVMAGGSVTATVLANDSDPDGTLDPGSVAVVTGPAHGTATPDPTTGRITYVHNGSAAGGDTFTYTVDDNEGNTSNQATVTVTITEPTGPAADNVILRSGWNAVALQVTPENPSVEGVVGGLERLVLVKDAMGRVYFPDAEIDEITEWDVTQAYKVLMEEEETLTVNGTTVSPETPIMLAAGWNLLPFFLETPQPVEDALESILDEVNYLTDDGEGVFDPQEGINTIGMLEPGRGYQIHLANDVTLVYAAPATETTVLYRINAGGSTVPAIDGGIAWEGDTRSSPSPYVTLCNTSENCNRTNNHGAPNSTHDSVDQTTTPLSIFATERWDPPSDPEMRWSFPTGNGEFVARLYLMNGYDGTSGAGQRVFDINVEGGALEVEGLDLSGTYGHKTAVMLDFDVTVSDGVLDIEFLRDVANPNVTGIEILGTTATREDGGPASAAHRRRAR